MSQQSGSILDGAVEESFIRKLLAEHFDGIVFIDCETGAIIDSKSSVSGCKLGKMKCDGAPYDTQMLDVLETYLHALDVKLTQPKITLSTIKKQLENAKRYEVSAITDESKFSRRAYKLLTYEYADDEHNVIAMTCEDVSNVVANEIDAQTGLYNSNGFYNHAKRWIANHPGKRFRVQRYNIDRFRDINGVYGHEIGNKLLMDVALHMKRYNSDDNFAAHLNADHFVRFCAADALTPEESYANFISSFNNYSLRIPITLHMGVYDLCEPDDDPYTMSYKALLALQSIKGSLKKKIAYYEKGMLAEERGQRELLSDVDTALKEGQFEIWFQPQVDYEEKRIIGAEALVRWQHPTRGLLMPASFIPLMEKSDYIGDLDKYMMDKACWYMRKWQNEILGDLRVPVSVNLSRKSVQRPELCDEIKKTIDKYELDTSSIHIEITESAYMQDSEALEKLLRGLRNMGVVIEMDDFGSGYSSLNSLKDLDIDKLKLDMRFLTGMKDSVKGRAIVSSIINMAQSLDLSVIAEGVESKEQGDMLSGFGCQHMQGFFFGKPMPASEYEKLLKAMCIRERAKKQGGADDKNVTEAVDKDGGSK